MAGDTIRDVPDPEWFKHDRSISIPRQRAAGRRSVAPTNADGGRVQTCELRGDSKTEAGWDVMVLEDGEPLFSRRCFDERGAR
jgi:hypothetical protein